MTESDQAYYMRRAREEREQAERSSHDAASSAHREMADAYERRAMTSSAARAVA